MLEQLLITQETEIIEKYLKGVIQLLNETYGASIQTSTECFKQLQDPQKKLYVIMMTLFREKSFQEHFVENEPNQAKYFLFFKSLQHLGENHLNFKISQKILLFQFIFFHHS